MLNNRDKESSLVEKLIAVNKTTKVVQGGKNLSFTVLVVVGDKKGKVNFVLVKQEKLLMQEIKLLLMLKRCLLKYL